MIVVDNGLMVMATILLNASVAFLPFRTSDPQTILLAYKLTKVSSSHVLTESLSSVGLIFFFFFIYLFIYKTNFTPKTGVIQTKAS